jgi:hypothetical protein
MPRDFEYQGVRPGNFADAAIVRRHQARSEIQAIMPAFLERAAFVTKISQRQFQIVGRSIWAIHAEGL